MRGSRKIVVIDNFDSFTYNLVHLLEAEGATCVVMRNNAIDWEGIDHCDGLVLGPGPGLPEEAGELMRVISDYECSKPILGICLGHQALGSYFGGHLVNLQQVYHGQEVEMTWIVEHVLTSGLPQCMPVGLYHSWSLEQLPNCEWKSTAISKQGVIMGLQHNEKPIHGLQFHPESVMTPWGRPLLRNWLNSIVLAQK